ncbi:MAG: hypothetical protein RIC15_10625 [Vicingaceae bacterium]
MKKSILSLLLTFSIIIGSAEELQTAFVCPSTELKNEIKPLLKPEYKYDSSKITRIKIKGQEGKVTEVEVPLFIGEKYKFIFNTAELQEDVVISVYNKKQGKSNRELLYSNQNDKDGKKTTFTWEPEKSRTMYINYEVPKDAGISEGCVVFLLGYRI